MNPSPHFRRVRGGFNTTPTVFDMTGVGLTPPHPFSTRFRWFQHHPTRTGRFEWAYKVSPQFFFLRVVSHPTQFQHEQTPRGGVPPFSFVFLSTQTRRGGDLPFSFVFLLTQTRRGGGSSFSVCHTDTTREGAIPSRLLSTPLDANGESSPFLATLFYTYIMYIINLH